MKLITVSILTVFISLSYLFASQPQTQNRDILSIHNPFDRTSVKQIPQIQTQRDISEPKKIPNYRIDAIINQSLLCNGKWYAKGQKIGDCTILKINITSSQIICSDKKIKTLKLYNNELN
jgi:hypothetical protein